MIGSPFFKFFVEMGNGKMSMEDEAELFMAIRDFECEGRERGDNGLDLTALNSVSDERILLRVIVSKSKTGLVGVDAVRKMLEDMKLAEYDRGFMIGKKFTDAAKKEMIENNIQRISEQYMPPFKPERIYLRINDFVNKMCEENCGKIPQTEADCKDHSQDHSCRTRAISDNASFHFEHGWIDLLKNDLKQLLSLCNSTDE